MVKNYRDRIEYFRQRWRHQKLHRSKPKKTPVSDPFINWTQNQGQQEFGAFKQMGTKIVTQGVYSLFELDELVQSLENLILSYFRKTNRTNAVQKQYAKPTLSLVDYLSLNSEGSHYWAQFSTALKSALAPPTTLEQLILLLSTLNQLSMAYLKHDLAWTNINNFEMNKKHGIYQNWSTQLTQPHQKGLK